MSQWAPKLVGTIDQGQLLEPCLSHQQLHQLTYPHTLSLLYPVTNVANGTSSMNCMKIVLNATMVDTIYVCAAIVSAVAASIGSALAIWPCSGIDSRNLYLAILLTTLFLIDSLVTATFHHLRRLAI